jgi:HEAT repeat protein
VRNAALEVVRTVGPGLPDALLVEAMEHPNGSMRASAIQALGVRAPAEKLLPAIGDSSEEVRLAAADALRLAHPQLWQRVISEVMDLVTSPGSTTILDSAAYCFISDLIGDLEQASPVLLEVLSSLLTHSYWEAQVKAAQALGQLRRNIPDSALRRLYSLRSHSASKAVRRAAEDALSEILTLEAGIEDEGYESVELPMSRNADTTE